MIKKVLCGLMIFGGVDCEVNGMFFASQNLGDRYGDTLRVVSEEEEEECLAMYEEGMATDNDTVNLKCAIIGWDEDYKALIKRGIDQAIRGGCVNFKTIYDGAVFKDVFATLAYRLESLKQYNEAFFWLKVAAVGNSNYLQDAQRVKNEYNKYKK